MTPCIILIVGALVVGCEDPGPRPTTGQAVAVWLTHTGGAPPPPPERLGRWGRTEAEWIVIPSSAGGSRLGDWATPTAPLDATWQPAPAWGGGYGGGLVVTGGGLSIDARMRPPGRDGGRRR